MALDPEKSPGYQVRRCHRRIDRLLAAKLDAHGLKSGYWYYLRILWMNDGVTQEYLSRMTNVTQNTTVSMIAGMVRAGLVRRERDTKDRRKMRVYLSAVGRQLESQLSDIPLSINRIAGRGIPKADLECCLRVLARMAENVQAESDELGLAD